MTGRQPETRNHPAWPRWAPPPALAGFVVLLAAVFALSYGVGSAAGPVAPGLHRTGTDAGSGGGMGGMGGTHPGSGR
ncbi:hypothetical protein [Streptomyces sp. NBC_01233]|uniref:hypothetical protein n=1 Tax=Streptomyces sp. NBC_01233 TaxID=2903787 RepID=UPI002E0E5FFC|nr:hypothetical protein OG332_38430 [Streptomyces sp. NBC_01233]